MRISDAELGWSRKVTGKYSARYTARRGCWAFSIHVPRDGSCTLAACRDGVLVRSEETGTLPESKTAALEMLSAAERMAWTGVARDSYRAYFEDTVFRAVRPEGSRLYTLTVEDEGVEEKVDEAFFSIRDVKSYVASLLDILSPPPVWNPLVSEPVEGFCKHCSHCREQNPRV